MGQGGAKKNEGPSDLEPDKEKRDDSKRAVDSIVRGNLYLQDDKYFLKNKPEYRSKDGADQGGSSLNLSVGEKKIHNHQGGDDEHKGNQFDDKGRHPGCWHN